TPRSPTRRTGVVSPSRATFSPSRAAAGEAAVTSDPPTEPGTPVAPHGPGGTGPLDPTVTSPDPGLAHPVPNPPPPPAAPPGHRGGRHARPQGSRRTGGWPLIGRRKDEQDGDTDG